jgi:hypothetical protein
MKPLPQAIVPRRSFGGSVLDPPGMTPKEDLMLDVTAWFVAIALVWSPDHDFDDLDYQNTSERQDEATCQHKKDDKDPKGHKKGH